MKRADAIVSKLRRLEEATEASNRVAFVKTARGLYTQLFSKVAALREGVLKTELTTAVVLYESSMRAALRGGGAADCAQEPRESYAHLCLETAAGGRAAFLRALARLHVGRARAELLYARGDRTDATLEAVALARAERETERALAHDALASLKDLLGAASSGDDGEANTVRFEALDRLLSSLPRDRPQQLLSEARDALRDALYWRHNSARALAPVIDARSYAPRGELPALGLRADDAARTAEANLRSALKFINKAEEELAPASSR